MEAEEIDPEMKNKLENATIAEILAGSDEGESLKKKRILLNSI